MRECDAEDIAHDAWIDCQRRGRSAERAFLAADDWENPFWLRLFEAAHWQMRYDASKNELSPLVPRCVKYLLLTDSRLPIVWERLKVLRPSFGTILGILKVRFGLCFQAYNAHRAFRRGLRF